MLVDASVCTNRATRWKRVAELVLFLGLLLVALGVLREASQRQRFTIDESRWIATSRYYWTTFAELDLFGTAWQPNYLVLTHPPVARYVFGFGLALQGWTPDQLNGRYDSLKSRALNEAAGNVPGPELLASARRVSLLLAVAAIGTLYLVGRAMAGPLAGLAAAFLALTNPLLSTLWTRALAEAALAFFFLLALLLAFRLSRGDGRSRVAIGLGASLGLAAATKLSGALGAIGVGLFGIVVAAIGWVRDGRLYLVPGLLAAGVVAVVAFTVVNPMLYPNPAERAWMMLDHRRVEMQQQRLTWPSQAVPDELLARAERMTVRVFQEFRSLPGPLDALLCTAGLVWLVAGSSRFRPRARAGAAELMLLCWVVVTYVGVAFNLGFDSSHYYAPLLTLNAVLEGMSVAVGAGLAWKCLQKIHLPVMNSGRRTAHTASNTPTPAQTSGPLPT